MKSLAAKSLVVAGAAWLLSFPFLSQELNPAILTIVVVAFSPSRWRTRLYPGLLVLSVLLSALLDAYRRSGQVSLPLLQPTPRFAALVTGASSGIGEAIARDLASRGFDLVLVARRKEVLEALAVQLKADHGVQVNVIPADLVQQGGVEGVAQSVERLREEGIVNGIDMLVNNAGIVMQQNFLDAAWETSRTILSLNVEAAMHLTHLLAPQMVARGRGRVMMVSSVYGSVVGGPYISTYAAGKAFLDSFTRALTYELTPKGVGVTLIKPGSVETNIFDSVEGRPGALVHMLPLAHATDVAAVAKEATDATLKGRNEVVLGTLNRAFTAISPILPRSLNLLAARTVVASPQALWEDWKTELFA